MGMVDADEPEQIVWQGKFITAKKRGRWEYVGRARGIRAAVVLAVEDGHVLLVEQFRVPLGKRCLELPAGPRDDAPAAHALPHQLLGVDERVGSSPRAAASLLQQQLSLAARH